VKVWSRRDCMTKVAGGVAAGAVLGGGLPAARAAGPGAAAGAAEEAKGDLALRDFEPRSMLHVKESRVERARFPVVDVHSHLTFARSAFSKKEDDVAPRGEVEVLIAAKDALAVMDRKNVRAMVNLTGGREGGVEQSIAAFDKAAPGRFLTCVEPSYGRIVEPGFPKWQADALERARRSGARGLKVLKTLGLFLRENVTEGPLVKVDDPRFDPMWEAAAAFDLPVFIHTADPEAFFLPVDRFNERWDELGHHPDWSFYGRDFPSFRELMEARDRVFARHPKTRFVALHVGHDAENLAFVGETLDRFPNVLVELGARIGELGRQPRTARRFFERYQDRILFGTDAVPPPAGEATPQQVFKDELYEIYFRFLETEDEYFDYAPSKVPPQGRWRIYGIGLPDGILKKVYHDNAVRLLGLSA
jgi:predicted TIM-barrel fold metal-dependent hydrolase